MKTPPRSLPATATLTARVFSNIAQLILPAPWRNALRNSHLCNFRLRWYLRRGRTFTPRSTTPEPPLTPPADEPLVIPEQLFSAPALRLVRASRSATEALARLGLSLDEVSDALATATIRPGHKGRRIAETGELFVVMDPAARTLIHIAPNNRAATPAHPQNPSPRPDSARSPQRRPPSHHPRQATEQRVPLPTTRRDYIALLSSRGFTVTKGRKHCKITHPLHPSHQCTIPASSSDHRWIRNSIRDVRHEFGIDLRWPPASA